MKRLVALMIALTLLPISGFAENLNGHELAKNFYSLVLKGDTKSILSAFSKTPNIDTPRTGAISGKKKMLKFLAEEKAWLESHGVNASSLTHTRTTQSADRIIYEQKITIDKKGPMKHQNFAVVVDLHRNKARSVRVYYSLNAVTGTHDFSRPAILKHDPALLDGLAAPAKQYVASIDNAFLDVHRLFTKNSCIGSFCGINHGKFFVIAMEAGSVPLKLTTSTCDASACAIEWNLASWGDTDFSINVGGIATFEFNEKGLITRGRIIDDIHDAPFSQKDWFANHWDSMAKGFESIECPLPLGGTSEARKQISFGKIMMTPCAE